MTTRTSITSKELSLTAKSVRLNYHNAETILKPYEKELFVQLLIDACEHRANEGFNFIYFRKTNRLNISIRTYGIILVKNTIKDCPIEFDTDESIKISWF